MVTLVTWWFQFACELISLPHEEMWLCLLVFPCVMAASCNSLISQWEHEVMAALHFGSHLGKYIILVLNTWVSILT
jgi:hypothetical protein